MLKHKTWQMGAMQLIGLVALAIGLYNTFTGGSLWWWAVATAVHFCISLSLTAGLHRLFSHNAYKTSRFWHVVLALVGSLGAAGSPIQWCVAHQQHHEHADTPLDPHGVKGWHSALLFGYVIPPYDFSRAKHLIEDKFQWWLHKNFWVPSIVYAAALLIIDWRLWLFGHLIPVGTVLLSAGIHNVLSHWGDGKTRAPINMWFLPLYAGEWLHKNHHDRPRDWDFRDPGAWWQYDPGAWFIKLIRKS